MNNLKKKNDKSSTIILALVACLLMFFNILMLISKYGSEDSSNELTNTTVLVKKTDEEKREELIADLKTMNERDRMERYFGEYIDHVESGNYEKAYNLLYPEFKENYFKTIDEFIKYVNEKYPEVIIIDYDNIERQGQYYVLFIKIPKSDGTGEMINQNIVIYEKDYADYYISFSL